MARRMARHASTEIDYRARIARAQRAIEARLDAPPVPAELAELAGFSLHHFHRVFRGVVGESVEEHARRLRLERAARRLRASELPVVQIALEAGYGSHEAFTRAFRDLFGMPPSRYRGESSLRAVGSIQERAVELRDIAPFDVVVRRHVGSCSMLDEAFGHVFAWAGARGVVPGAARVVGLYHDDPEVTARDRLRSDVGIETSLAPGPASGLERRTIPGGRYAVALHVGPYHTIGSTYLALLGRWAPTTRAELAPEPVIEHYLTPQDTPPDQHRTEVWIRLRS
ncbi:Transcriptional regulator, AraC family protein [Sandaracinus amylolyticus]|uniref:Transcriptional regulator, AraC family protein n=2 Tax=Sandaracinus amylolyticus TaxID=927083 RepID=A0A0F6W2B4_9BACT|nr:Transcriptional regulator, AraC family protein [Sandaracinus amylolyticus]